MSQSYDAIMICSIMAAIITIVFSVMLAGIEGKPKHLLWLLVLVFPAIVGYNTYQREDDFTVNTVHVEALQKEIRLHYPTLRKKLHEECMKNENYGLTVGQYKLIKYEMKIVDEEKLNDLGPMEF